jgi:cell division septation protein DedD
MSNKSVVGVFIAGLALLLTAFWAGLYVVREPQPVSSMPEPPPPQAEAQTPPPATVEPEAPKPGQTDARYVVQVSSFGTAEKANELVAQLRKKFLATYVQSPTTDDPLYRVRIGAYTEHEQAQQVVKQLSAQGFKGLTIITLKQN